MECPILVVPTRPGVTFRAVMFRAATFRAATFRAGMFRAVMFRAVTLPTDRQPSYAGAPTSREPTRSTASWVAVRMLVQTLV
jgi:hypothetical protein